MIIKLELHANLVNSIMQALGELPLKVSLPAFQEVNRQYAEQLVPQGVPSVKEEGTA